MTTAHQPSRRILAQLGQGGMARIQLALRRGPGGFRKLYVIKEMRPELVDENYAKMFLHEARLAALLSHPNIVQSHFVSQDRDNCFLEMEYLEGQTLARLVRRVTRDELPLETHLHVLTELLAGLSHAHELCDLSGRPMDVVHRDVSPGNVFLTYEGQVKLLDFGIAKSVELFELPSQTKGQVKGKVGYMSPEQARADKVDQRSDLYSVGIMLWEAIACQPFVPRGEATEKSMADRRAGERRCIKELCPEVAPALLEICNRALSPDPANRFQTARELREALLDHLHSLSVQPTREDLSEIVKDLFVHEKQELDTIIADKIASDISSEDTLISQAFFRGSGRSLSPHAEAASQKSADQRRKTLVRRTLMVAAPVLAVCAFGVWMSGKQDPQLSETSTMAAPSSLVQTQPPALAPKQKAAPSKGSDPTSPPETPELVKLRLRVTPPQASVYLDGEFIGKGDLQQNYPKDELEHTLHLSLDGYEEIERIVSLDQNQTLELALSPVKSQRSRRRPSTSVRTRQPSPRKNKGIAVVSKKDPAQAAEKTEVKRAPTTRAGDDLRALGPKRTRSIDKENPYK